MGVAHVTVQLTKVFVCTRMFVRIHIMVAFMFRAARAIAYLDCISDTIKV